MFITTLRIHELRQSAARHTTTAHPTRQQVADAIKALDGVARTSVSLETRGESFMVVGGGDGGRYIVFAVISGVMHDLLSWDDPRPVRMVCGGQDAEYPGYLCVQLDAALAAAKGGSGQGIHRARGP